MLAIGLCTGCYRLKTVIHCGLQLFMALVFLYTHHTRLTKGVQLLWLEIWKNLTVTGHHNFTFYNILGWYKNEKYLILPTNAWMIHTHTTERLKLHGIQESCPSTVFENDISCIVVSLPAIMDRYVSWFDIMFIFFFNHGT